MQNYKKYQNFKRPIAKLWNLLLQAANITLKFMLGI